MIGCWRRGDGDVLLIISNFDDNYRETRKSMPPFQRGGKFAVAETPTTEADGAGVEQQHFQYLCARQLVPRHLDQAGQRRNGRPASQVGRSNSLW